MGRIGVGIVGLSARGGWGANAHLPALRRIPDFHVVALAASTPESAESSRSKHGVDRAYHSPEDLAADPEVDLVVVAVRVPEHRAIVRAALDAGKHVYCEWPLGIDLAEAQDMAGQARRAGVRSFIGLQGRAAPQIRYLRQLIEAGFAGEVLSATLVASGVRWGESIPLGSVYLTEARNGATMLTIPFSHALDAIEQVLGPLTELCATVTQRRNTVRIEETGEIRATDTPDQVVVTGRMESGAILSAHYRGGMFAGTNFHLEINGSRGDLLLTGPSGHMQYGQLTLAGARSGEFLRELPLPPELVRFPCQPGDLSYTLAHAYAGVLADLRTGSRSIPGFDEAVERHARIEQILLASRSGTRINLPGR